MKSEELLELLAPAIGRTGLVVLSACESAVARAARHAQPRRKAAVVPVPGAPAALGYEVARRVGGTVLAMRYPVDDEFSVSFMRGVYEGLFTDGLPVDETVRQVLSRLRYEAGRAPLALVTPIVLGRPDTRVTVRTDRPVLKSMTSLPEEPSISLA